MLAQMSLVAQTNRSFCRARRRVRRPPALRSLLVGLLCLAGPGAATAAIEDGTRLGCETLPRLMRTYSVILHLPMAYWTLTLMVASASMIVTSLYFGLAVIVAAGRMPVAGLEELEGDVGLGRELART